MVRSDFNGDGRSDILWILGDSLAVTNWLAMPGAKFAGNDANAYNWLTAMHRFDVAATGDFNGDGRTDVVWQIDSGDTYSISRASPGGGLGLDDSGGAFSGGGWKIVGSGDFNGDGIDDILWRAADGRVGNWLGNRGGGFTVNEASIVPVSTEWHVSGTGDFNGDGRSDILWTSDGGLMGNWLASANGTFVSNADNSLMQGRAENILAIGDFNGDNLDDILFRDASNEVFMMEVFQGGAFYPGWGLGYVKTIPQSWNVSAVGDYNGDGTDDLLWRNDNGALGTWFGIKNDGYRYTINDGDLLYNVPTTWQVADHVLSSAHSSGFWDY